ncbi:hypothetical protein D3C77_458050 [compost metagenome]
MLNRVGVFTAGILVFDSAILITEAYDVVLTKVIATLHFNQDKVDHARIHQSMFVTCPDERGLIGVEHKLFGIINNYRRTTNNNPVLAAVVMHLQ